MKALILKLGLLIFSVLFIAGVWRNIPTATLIFRSFVAFIVVETLLVLVAVSFIKMTEKIRREIVEEEEVLEEESGSSEE